LKPPTIQYFDTEKLKERIEKYKKTDLNFSDQIYLMNLGDVVNINENAYEIKEMVRDETYRENVIKKLVM
jgi:hypothetical protein